MTPDPETGESTSSLVEIDEHECWRLLETVSVGRLAVPAGDLAPAVFPINFVIDDWVIVFRTGIGEKLIAALRGPVSFQADSFDPLHRTGWSVLVRGVAYQADASEIERVYPDPWAPGDRDIWMRLTPLEVTGRRIEQGLPDVDGRGYR